MPSSTRLATPGPSTVSQSFKRAMSDSESAPHDPKRARRNSSIEPGMRHDSSRDTKRRRRKKKKAPVVGPAAVNEATHSRLDGRSRVPLSVRNEVVTFSSGHSEADPSASALPATEEVSPSKLFNKSRQGSSQIPGDVSKPQGTPSIPSDKEQKIVPGLLYSSLEERVAQLEAELVSKNALITTHQAFLNQVQQAVTCQVCLDLMYKPYALAPCGHLACYSCLVSWFTVPPPDDRPAPPAISRRKTCPHCRAVVRERPVEVWGVKGIAQAAGKSGLLPNQLPVPVEDAESLNANTDPWKNIFANPGSVAHHQIPWFEHDDDIDDDDIHIADFAPRGEDLGMLDMEDGGIYRCLDCMHEIWDGICSNCARVYPGHQARGDDDDDEDQIGWLEDHMGAEEVNVADDPSWMGLEDGEADDDGDPEDWFPYEHWRRRFHVFRGPWGVLGTIPVDEEDEREDEEVYGQLEDFRVAEDDEGSEGEGYESSFIDDGDERVEIADIEDGPRIYEIGDDEDDYSPDHRSRTVDLYSDEGEEEERLSDVPECDRRYASPVASDEDEDDIIPSRRSRRVSRFVESDDSDPLE